MALYRFFSVIFFLVWSTKSFSEGAEITVFYADNPPLICMKDGRLDCISGRLINMAADIGGYKIIPREIPWARAEESLSSTRNAVFASTGKNDFTEKSSTWFFEVYSDDVNVWTLDGKKISSEMDILKLKTIAVRRGSPFLNYLTKINVVNKAVEVNDWKQAVAMLEAGRVDAMCLTELVGNLNLVKLAGIKPERVNKYKVGEMAWSITTAKDVELTPDLVGFQSALSIAKNTDEYRAFFSKFKGEH